jgi:hypothetical protein
MAVPRRRGGWQTIHPCTSVATSATSQKRRGKRRGRQETLQLQGFREFWHVCHVFSNKLIEKWGKDRVGPIPPARAPARAPARQPERQQFKMRARRGRRGRIKVMPVPQAFLSATSQKKTWQGSGTWQQTWQDWAGALVLATTPGVPIDTFKQPSHSDHHKLGPCLGQTPEGALRLVLTHARDDLRRSDDTFAKPSHHHAIGVWQ